MVLKITDLVKVYRGGTRANDGISMFVEPGEIYGLLGPNGAGKTTLVKQVVGLVAPTSGTIELDGVDVVRKPQWARRTASFQPQSTVPIDGLTAFEAIQLTGRLRGLDSRTASARTRELIAALEIEEWTDRPGQSLSGGVRRLVGFCMGVVAPGKIAILDEPTNDVDPLRRRHLWKWIRNLADSGTTVLLVTHNVLEAEKAVDRLAVIDKGRVLASGTPGALKGETAGGLRLELATAHDAAPLALPATFRAYSAGRRIRASIPAEDVTDAIEWAAARQREGVVEEYSLAPASLEDAYVRMIGRADVLEESQVGKPIATVA
ncbi:MAG: ABC transporter ATP-binding protein [Coriobacteriia bacterium]|nr:ABC transporter ATP-binding protein [Coriobacteriia bacterium]